jgi:hypothetical protein
MLVTIGKGLTAQRSKLQSGSIPQKPSILTAPVVSGAANVGEVLTVTNGSWAHTPSSFTYQWRRGGVSITGATSASYTLVSADEGSNIDCFVIATNSAGSASAASNDISVTAAATASGTIAGLKITMTGHTQWIGINDLAIEIDGSGNDIVDNLTRVNGPLDFTGLSAGQYGTNSSYDDNDALWRNAAWNNVDDPTVSGAHWSSTPSATFILYFKFAVPVAVDKVKIFFNNPVMRGIPTTAFEDLDGNAITAQTIPADAADTIYNGSFAAAYEWVF